MPQFEKEKIEEIKTSTRIVDVISKYVTLKKTGASFVGECPFHGGKSFNVNPVNNYYKCYGCGKYGNAITFLMEARNKTYPEALTMLAEQFNVIL